MQNAPYSLAVTDEKLQAAAEQIQVWNFAKKARKVINVLQGELEKEGGEDIQEVKQALSQAMKYAGVSFSEKERTTFLELIAL